eukprot:Hpha_TRINITY_DN3302_c0_g1::TRINITY_DN3302_c0_g1_i1::g.172467::m.172467
MTFSSSGSRRIVRWAASSARAECPSHRSASWRARTCTSATHSTMQLSTAADATSDAAALARCSQVRHAVSHRLAARPSAAEQPASINKNFRPFTPTTATSSLLCAAAAASCDATRSSAVEQSPTCPVIVGRKTRTMRVTPSRAVHSVSCHCLAVVLREWCIIIPFPVAPATRGLPSRSAAAAALATFSTTRSSTSQKSPSQQSIGSPPPWVTRAVKSVFSADWRTSGLLSVAASLRWPNRARQCAVPTRGLAWEEQKSAMESVSWMEDRLAFVFSGIASCWAKWPTQAMRDNKAWESRMGMKSLHTRTTPLKPSATSAACCELAERMANAVRQLAGVSSCPARCNTLKSRSSVPTRTSVCSANRMSRSSSSVSGCTGPTMLPGARRYPVRCPGRYRVAHEVASRGRGRRVRFAVQRSGRTAGAAPRGNPSLRRRSADALSARPRAGGRRWPHTRPPYAKLQNPQRTTPGTLPLGPFRPAAALRHWLLQVPALYSADPPRVGNASPRIPSQACCEQRQRPPAPDRLPALRVRPRGPGKHVGGHPNCCPAHRRASWRRGTKPSEPARACE